MYGNMSSNNRMFMTIDESSSEPDCFVSHSSGVWSIHHHIQGASSAAHHRLFALVIGCRDEHCKLSTHTTLGLANRFWKVSVNEYRVQSIGTAVSHRLDIFVNNVVGSMNSLVAAVPSPLTIDTWWATLVRYSQEHGFSLRPPDYYQYGRWAVIRCPGRYHSLFDTSEY